MLVRNFNPITGSGNSGRQRCVGYRRQHATHDRDGRVELRVDVVARTGAPAEFRLAVPHVAGAAEDRADEVLKVAGEVKRQVAGELVTPGSGRPDALVVWKLRELAFESFELADEGTSEVGGTRSRRLLVAGLDERARAHLGDGLPQLVFRVHHDRPVPRHRLFDRLARHEQEADAVFARLHGHFVAAIEQDERSIADVVGAGGGGGR